MRCEKITVMKKKPRWQKSSQTRLEMSYHGLSEKIDEAKKCNQLLVRKQSKQQLRYDLHKLKLSLLNSQPKSIYWVYQSRFSLPSRSFFSSAKFKATDNKLQYMVERRQRRIWTYIMKWVTLLNRLSCFIKAVQLHNERLDSDSHCYTVIIKEASAPNNLAHSKISISRYRIEPAFGRIMWR